MYQTPLFNLFNRIYWRYLHQLYHKVKFIHRNVVNNIHRFMSTLQYLSSMNLYDSLKSGVSDLGLHTPLLALSSRKSHGHK